MIDFALARRTMVDCQVRTSDVTDRRLIAAMLDIPRERFLPEHGSSLAYLDIDVPVAPGTASGGRRMLKPMVLAKLLQAGEIDTDDHVLVVGCATGYAAAVLARMARSVVALEQDSGLARQAAANLLAIGVGNATVVIGPLAEGWQALAPYDVILVDGATESAPTTLLRQLRDGGRLVGIVGHAPSAKAMVFRSVGQSASGRPIFDAAASVLPGFAQDPAFVF